MKPERTRFVDWRVSSTRVARESEFMQSTYICIQRGAGRSFGGVILSAIAALALVSCAHTPGTHQTAAHKYHVIFDTDADNEIDDQHALAYLLFSGDVFAVEGVTVNATSSPVDGVTESHVSDHYAEAERVMRLCGVFNRIPLLTGVQGSFEEIKGTIDQPDFDGHEAVDFIIEQALRERGQKLILLPVGKLTNIALALLKEPAIAANVRIVWLGSNYPRPGEHNQDWDVPAMNYILDVDVPFEMVTVRYGDPSGTDAVKVTQAQILHRMPGKGPRIAEPITGRHGGEFDNWGDYAANLFEMYGMWGNPPSRPLFDQAAVAIVKNPAWAERYDHPAPIYLDKQWVERPDNPRKITIWEWFDIYAIINDFFVTMDNYVLAERP
jgi:purine nucleosidase